MARLGIPGSLLLGTLATWRLSRLVVTEDGPAQVVVKRLKRVAGPVEIYRESDMITRTIRDIFTNDIDTIWVDEPNAFAHASEFLQIVMPRYASRIRFFGDTEPLFHRYGIEDEIAKLLLRRASEPDRCVLVGAYALGKAQRVIAELRRAGWHEAIFLHGALERMCRLYEELGVPLGELRLVSASTREDMRGQIVLCPPSALTDTWSRRMPNPITAMASGWMRVRGRARQRNVELPLIVSDHADWDELTATIHELAPQETWITHGSEEGLLRWCELHQIRARALDMVGRDEEDDG